MCQFTLQKYADCGHTKLLTDAINTVFCKPIAKQLQRSCYQGLDVAPACCHPLPIPQDNEIAAALQEDLDFDTYNQEDENRIAKLRDSIEESGKKAEKIAEDFEVSMNNDITRLNLNGTLLEPGRKKYDELFMQRRVPRRMFEDLVHFIEKKAARAAGRAGQLSSIGEYIVGDAGSGDSEEAIASLFGDIAESVFVERHGFAPQRAAEHGYLNERQEDGAHIISCSETEAKRLVEIELVTSQYVPAKRNNAGSALYDFPMRQRDFGARLAMSNATFANDKLPKIMGQRNLTVLVTNVLLPHVAAEEAVREAMHREKLEKQKLEKEKLLTAFMEQYSLYEEVPLDEETATSPDEGRTSADADGSKLPASEPAHSIWIKHEKFVDVDRPSLTSKEAIALALRCEYPLGDDDDWECNEVPQESAQVPSEEATQPAPKPKPDTVGRTFTCDFGDDDDDREDRETLVESSEEVDASAPPFNSDTKMEADKHMPSTPTCSTYGTISPHVSTQSPSPSPQSSLGPILRKRSSEQDPPHDKSPSQKSRKNSDAFSGEEMWLKDSESNADGKVDGDTTVESTPATEDVGMPQTPAQNAASPSSYQSTPSPPWHITIGPRATIEFGAATPLGPIVRKRRSEDDILGDESPLQKARMNYEREG